MSRSYAERRLAEALAQASGSASAARRFVLGWIASDDRLLRELVEPFLAGIVGHAVERLARRMPRPADPSPLPKAALDGVIRTLHRNFDASGAAAPPAPAGHAASSRHVETMHMLARAHLHNAAGLHDPEGHPAPTLRHSSSARR